jgi:F-type H+-transporting ATPase subunit b
LNIVPDATVLVTFALVWILVLILSRVFFKPVGRILGERRAKIEEAKAETGKILEAYEEDLRRIDDRLREARAASDEIWERAETQALEEKTRLIQEIQAETRAQVEKAKRELAQQVAVLKKELDGKTEQLSGEIERRVLN